MQYNRLQAMPLTSPKISDTQLYSNQSKTSHNNSNHNLYNTSMNFSNNPSINLNGT